MAEQQLDPQLDDLRQFDCRRRPRTSSPWAGSSCSSGSSPGELWYLWTFTPGLGGWSQAQDLEGGGAPMGVNLLATIAFTAIPTTAAVVLILAQRRKGKKQAR